ncbi:uncharacterized protein LOC115632870 [Scaptodrosophila lebanonensis]|uniref:Uncharacterized protein LOC115632870 n=1 Tax=Drosophila lebanonensis TaxID=7225 RepID=A0A6J2UC70_DROLE|nr:uncharacterized protein LOC115632870 [Scaptodrosophila lebanonensis]
MSSGNGEVCPIIRGILKDLTQRTPLSARSESMTWLMPSNTKPIWSRRLFRNIEGTARQDPSNKWHAYDIEITDRLWSLWGSMHPCAAWFDNMVRGRQTLGCCVVACCAASVFRRLADWNAKLLDAIVVNGDKYYRESVVSSQRWDHNLGVDDMSLHCEFESMRFMVQLQLLAFGHLYSGPASAVMSLSEALSYFFTRCQWGILECQQRRLAFGYTSTHEGGYFMYDCSEWDRPIFPNDMGASYILRTKQLIILLYCLIVTLNVQQKNVEFRLYNADIARIQNNENKYAEDDEVEVKTKKTLKH